MADTGRKPAWRGNPVLAFLLTSLIVAAGLSAYMLSRLWGAGPGARFDLDRDGGFVMFVFLLMWFITLLAGGAVGVPVLLGLRRLGLHRRAAMLIPAGLLAGAFAALAIGAAFGLGVADDPSFIALGSGAGFAAALSWRLFAVEPRRDNG